MNLLFLVFVIFIIVCVVSSFYYKLSKGGALYQGDTTIQDMNVCTFTSLIHGIVANRELNTDMCNVLQRYIDSGDRFQHSWKELGDILCNPKYRNKIATIDHQYRPKHVFPRPLRWTMARMYRRKFPFIVHSSNMYSPALSTAPLIMYLLEYDPIDTEDNMSMYDPGILNPIGDKYTLIWEPKVINTNNKYGKFLESLRHLEFEMVMIAYMFKTGGHIYTITRTGSNEYTYYDDNPGNMPIVGIDKIISKLVDMHSFAVHPPIVSYYYILIGRQGIITQVFNSTDADYTLVTKKDSMGYLEDSDNDDNSLDESVGYISDDDYSVLESSRRF